ncbi:hypothetical protein [Larkinella rosea]|nr:hypothetical protein [Larkinella rosea]
MLSITVKDAGFHIANGYSAITWTLLAIVVLTGSESMADSKQPAVATNL